MGQEVGGQHCAGCVTGSERMSASSFPALSLQETAQCSFLRTFSDPLVWVPFSPQTLCISALNPPDWVCLCVCLSPPLEGLLFQGRKIPMTCHTPWLLVTGACSANIWKVKELIIAWPCPRPPKGMFHVGPSGVRHTCFLLPSPLYLPLLEVRPSHWHICTSGQAGPSWWGAAQLELISQAWPTTCAHHMRLRRSC